MLPELNRFNLINGDCIEEIEKIPDNSIHLSIFSPPFSELYVYSDDFRDLGNCKDYDEFFEHYDFLSKQLYRIMMPGRLVCVHCMFLPIMKGKEGYIGFRNFPGRLIDNHLSNRFILNGPPITIWKDPVTEMQRTKAIGLLNKQKDKDATISRTGNPDFILVFRKDGDNEIPVTHHTTDPKHSNYMPVDAWQKIASPVWYDINYSNTLNKEGKENDDEKHIAPLQLETINRLVRLYSNPDEIVFTPFLGIGSEAYESIKLGRRALGIELKKSYYEIALKNCRNAMLSNSQLSLV